MTPAHRYYSPPHKPECSCSLCNTIRRAQEEAYADGHQDGYLRRQSEEQEAVARLRAAPRVYVGQSHDEGEYRECYSFDPHQKENLLALVDWRILDALAGEEAGDGN